MTTRRFLRSLIPLLLLAFVAVSAQEAAARAGRGRSFGSRGTSSYRTTTRPAPTYDSGGTRQSSPSSPSAPFGQNQPGGFLRGLGGGLVGGLLGGLLFQSLGIAGPGAGGGSGLFNLLLLAGGGFLLYRFIAARRRAQPVPADSPLFSHSPLQGKADTSRYGSERPEGWGPAAAADGPASEGLARIRRSDPSFDEARFRDTAQDIFFRIQGAWTRRDLTAVEALLGGEVRLTLQADLDDLLHRGEINRLENIAVREAEIVEASQDQGQDVVTLRLLASLLDYTTDEAGLVRAGSDREPVKFEEFWTFTRPVGAGPWRLTAIQQAG